jgi:beta-lactam-binding protein with PASTA domain
MSTRQDPRPEAGREKEAPGRVAMQCIASATGTFVGEALGPTLAGKLITGLLGAGIGAFLTASGGRHRRRIVAVALLVALLNLFRSAADAVASEGRRPKSAWVPANWAVVGLTAMAGFAVGSVVTTATGGWDEDGSPSVATIPLVRGEARESALGILEDAGFRVTSVSEPSEAVAKGRATRTDPPARTRVGEDAKVTLFVSTGPPPARVKVPEVAGQSRAGALALLRDAGLRTRTRTESSETVANGAAIRTSPPADATVARNTRVTLFVSSGPAPAPVTVPEVEDLPRNRALARLQAAGLRPISASESSDQVEKGLAIRTDPTAGAKVARGTAVRLFISSGPVPQKLDVPDVTGYPEGKALTILENLTLRPTSESEPSTRIKEGAVTRTAPAAGSSVDKDSELTVFVSSGPPPPECRDGIDNDNDGLTDLPDDTDCRLTHGRSETKADPTVTPDPSVTTDPGDSTK